MRHLPIIFMLAVLTLPTLRATAQEGSEKLLVGPITFEQLMDIPGWFGKEFLEYRPEMQYVEMLPAHLKDVHIVCFLGTWCDDSRRDVPRLIRLMQMKGIEISTLNMYGLDHSKHSPSGEEFRYNVTKLPTFIFMRGETELGRIVEQPATTLEKDIVGIFDPSVVAPPPPAAPETRPDDPEADPAKHHPPTPPDVERRDSDSAGTTPSGDVPQKKK